MNKPIPGNYHIENSDSIGSEMWNAIQVAICGVVSLFWLASAQTHTTTAIHGRAFDACAEPFAHGTVKLTASGDTELVAKTQTDSDGEFVFENLPPKTYDLHLESVGFEPHVEAITVTETSDSKILVMVNRKDLVLCPTSSPAVRFDPAPIPTSLTKEDSRQGNRIETLDDPIKTTVCEVLMQPERFNGKMVSVRGRVLIEFEEFRLDAGQCAGNRLGDVWLEYGRGPKRQPTTWCCGDMVPRDPLQVEQNQDFRKFHDRCGFRRRKSLIPS